MNQRFLSIAAAAALGLALAGCGGDTGEQAGSARESATESRTAEGTGGAGNAAAGANGDAAGASEVREYTFHGTVKKIDTERGMITIDHEKIGDYMEAMTMPFKVADPALLETVKVGQQTHFTLRVAGDQALITKVQDEHDEGQAH